MKKYISLVLILSFVSLAWAQRQDNSDEENDKGYQEGFYEGRITGGQSSQTDWMMYGCLGGGLLGCIGGGGVWLLSNSGDMPPYVPKGGSDYKQGYMQGYAQATKSKKSSNALIGGIIGTVIGGVITYAIIVAAE